MPMIEVEIDGRKVEVPEGSMLMDAAGTLSAGSAQARRRITGSAAVNVLKCFI